MSQFNGHRVQSKDGFRERRAKQDAEPCPQSRKRISYMTASKDPQIDMTKFLGELNLLGKDEARVRATPSLKKRGRKAKNIATAPATRMFQKKSQPMMDRARKTMQQLKHNRCIPKQRAHTKVDKDEEEEEEDGENELKNIIRELGKQQKTSPKDHNNNASPKDREANDRICKAKKSFIASLGFHGMSDVFTSEDSDNADHHGNTSKESLLPPTKFNRSKILDSTDESDSDASSEASSQIRCLNSVTQSKPNVKSIHKAKRSGVPTLSFHGMFTCEGSESTLPANPEALVSEDSSRSNDFNAHRSNSVRQKVSKSNSIDVCLTKQSNLPVNNKKVLVSSDDSEHNSSSEDECSRNMHRFQKDRGIKRKVKASPLSRSKKLSSNMSDVFTSEESESSGCGDDNDCANADDSSSSDTPNNQMSTVEYATKPCIILLERLSPSIINKYVRRESPQTTSEEETVSALSIDEESNADPVDLVMQIPPSSSPNGNPTNLVTLAPPPSSSANQGLHFKVLPYQESVCENWQGNANPYQVSNNNPVLLDASKNAVQRSTEQTCNRWGLGLQSVDSSDDEIQVVDEVKSCPTKNNPSREVGIQVSDIPEVMPVRLPVIPEASVAAKAPPEEIDLASTDEEDEILILDESVNKVDSLQRLERIITNLCHTHSVDADGMLAALHRGNVNLVLHAIKALWEKEHKQLAEIRNMGPRNLTPAQKQTVQRARQLKSAVYVMIEHLSKITSTTS